MSELISYAQNGEDVVLHRALRHVKRGFYIDVGAYDPAFDSVTKLFYELGWSGINVEPSKAMYDRLMLERPRDRNLNVALSDKAGELTFYRVGKTGLSTLDVSAADKARGEGFDVEETQTEATTLADLCRNCRVGDIHFLKIDVEGFERQVLIGADFTSFRPWVIVIEATKPGTSERIDDQWRDLLEEAEYDQVLFDGLNLFFLAREHSDMRPLLLTSANVTDHFVPVQQHAAMLRLSELQVDIKHGENILAESSPDPLRELIVWHSAVARENLEREAAEQIVWHRADAEAAVRRSMEDTIAWNRADAEAVTRRAMEDTIAWNRADAEAAVRRSMEDTIAWHRADAAQRAFKSETDLSATRLREVADRSIHDRKVAEETMKVLRQRRGDEAARYAAAETKFHAVCSQHNDDVIELDRAYRELVRWRESVRCSTSWRLTRPLRVVGRIMKRLLSAGRQNSS